MSPRPLSTGSQIDGYKIREVLGMGGLGITYRAHDSKLDREVALREYLPTSHALRHINFSITPINGDHESKYVQGLANFLDVSKSLIQLNHDNIVKVHSVVEANNTAYMVMECELGASLDNIIEQRGTLEQNHQTQIFFPIFEGLQKIHELGFVHRGIKPSDIRIRENGSPVLLDFGSARQTSLLNQIESTAMANQSYMPLEQYSSDYGEQGPWTDIYSLAAIMYQGVTGVKPDEALSRSDYLLRDQPDTVQPLSTSSHPTYQQSFLSALHSGLTLQPQFRPQSLALWQLLFEGDLVAYRLQSADALLKASHNSSKTSSDQPSAPATGSEPQPQTDATHQTIAEIINGAASETFNEVKNPLETTTPDDADGEFQNVGALATQSKNQNAGIRSFALGSAIAAILVVFMGIMLVQNDRAHIDSNTNISNSEFDSLEKNEQINIAAADEPNDTLTTDAETNSTATSTQIDSPANGDTNNSLTASNTTEISAGNSIVDTLTANKVFFDKPVPNDPQSDNPRTILEILESEPQYSPIEGMDDKFWKEKACSDCHDWTRTSLCQQGDYYTNGNKSLVTRIQHPFGGYFKLALKQWAENDCS